jgi:hypothetical protein
MRWFGFALRPAADSVPTGWGGWIKGFAPNLFGRSRGAALIVFALPA